MSRLQIRRAFVCAAFLFLAAAAAPARAAGPTPAAAPAGGPADYATFTKGLTAQRGLFTIWRKDGKIYLDLSKDQLDTDFIETAVPANGLGGYGITPGLPYLQFPTARIMRFARVDDQIVVTWPNTSFVAPDGTPAARAVAQSFAPSVVATAPVVAADPASGRLILDASFFLGDLLNLSGALRQQLGTDKLPGASYSLEAARSYFGPAKAFPENVIIEADQTFASAQPPDTFDNVTDARAIQIVVKYNLAAAPPLGTYMPRLADDRVGYYPNTQLEFGNDRVRERQVRTIARWNLARHQMVYYISNTVPDQYRAAIRSALLEWNKAFAKIGYPEAVIVKDQPDDPAWDPDDIRYNTVHWLTQSNNGGYAQAGLVWDPRTGELIHTSIVIDADVAAFGYQENADFTNPLREGGEPGSFETREAAYAAGAHASAMFGLEALRAAGDVTIDRVPEQYAQDFIKSIVLHESGHNWGLQHNFIASEAYSARQIQSKAFTSQYGIANSVMEYAPTNVWTKGTSTGDYFQLVLGPYDYYAIKWGYAAIPGAKTPEAERPTLNAWASVWSDPRYRFAMDEDIQWGTGHAIDPRIDWFDLTDDNIGWCEAQFKVSDVLIQSIQRRFTQTGETHEPLREAFAFAMVPLSYCAPIAWHYLGGEELSRAHIGDPHAQPPLTPVSRAQSQRAFALLDAHLFGTAAWNVSPSLLRQMVYTEWVTDFPSPSWAYDPPLRHDIPIATMALGRQARTLTAMFAPTLLQRIDDLPLKYSHGSTMDLSDLFDWTSGSIFGDLARGKPASSEIHRNLQQFYARMLARMVVSPAPGTPYDAQSLARAELKALKHDVQVAGAVRGLDAMTQAHLDALADVADQALSARTVIPAH
jgi:hypothetical protein